MNKKSWLIVGLSLAMAASIGVGISACGGKEPDTPPTPTEHTHNYDAWDYNETQHWKYCDEHGEDKSNIDETTREGHTFTNGSCECGMKEADVTPDEDLDTREFWVTGSGAGDLKDCGWDILKDTFKLTRQPKKDAEGFTLYTIQFKIYAGGDNFKIRQDERDTAGALVWTDGTYFGLNEIKENDGTFVDGGLGNIAVAKGKDGIYKFTVHTKPAPAAWADNYVSFELVEPVEGLPKTEDIYIVGNLKEYPTNAWPTLVKNSVQKDCVPLEFDGDKTWSTTVRLRANVDTFKLYNTVNNKYYPDPDPNLTVKTSGDYKISWVVGTNTVTLEPVEHTHYFSRMGQDETQHWKICWLDDTADPDGTRENHVYDDDQDATCNTCGYERHLHKYTEWGKDETQHWKQCPTDKAIDDSTRADHTFDPDTNKCECGMEKVEECDHEGTVTFSYSAETRPELVATGGTIKGTCSKCGKEVDVPYDVGEAAEGVNKTAAPTKAVIFENDKTYYVTCDGLTSQAWSRFYLGYEIKAAGTLTLNVDVVYYADETRIPGLRNLAVTAKDFTSLFAVTDWSSTANKADVIIGTGKWKQEAWKERIEVDELDEEKANLEPLHTLKITFNEEDVGKYLHMEIGTMNTGILLHVNFAPAAAAAMVAPQEVAMLPEKKD